MLAGAGLVAALVVYFLPSAGGGGPCQPPTAECLKTAALKRIADSIFAEDDPQRMGNHANRLLRWRPHLSAEEWAAALLQMEDAGAYGDRFWDPIKADDAERAVSDSLSYEGIRTAVFDRTWPKQWDWKPFIREAVNATLSGPDADKLADLWLAEQAFFDEFAKAPARTIRDWVILNRFEDAARLAETPDGRRTLSAGLSTLIYAAEDACRTGESDLATRIRALHADLAGTQVYEPKLGFLPLSQTFRAVLACDGEEAALARLAEIETAVEALPKGGILEHRGIKFSVDRWRADEMSDEVFWPLVEHYMGLGKTDTALEFYIRANGHRRAIGATADGRTLTVADIGSPEAQEAFGDQDALREKWAPAMDEEMAETMFYRQRYAAEGEGAAAELEFFLASFDPPFKICCTDQQQLQDMIELVVTAKGGQDPGAAIARTLDLAERAVASGKASGIILPTVKLTLARVEKALGCEIPDDRIGAWLSGIESYRYEDHRQIALHAAYQLVMTPKGTPSAYRCQLG